MSKAALSLLLLQALCCTLTSAQPQPPMMTDTFEGAGEVEFHGAESTTFGKFVLARDQMGMKGFEREEYEKGGPNELTETVLRYDMNKTYYLRGSMAQPHCLEEDRNFNGMPKFWAWLTTAMYEGTTTVREVLYDMWGTNIGGVRFEFGKPQTNASIVYFYRRKTTESSVFYSFMSYRMTPDQGIFDVPSECKARK